MPSSKKQRAKERRLEKDSKSRRDEILHVLQNQVHDAMVSLRMKEYVAHIKSLLEPLRSASSVQSFYKEFFDSIDDQVTSFFVTLKESKVFHDKIRNIIPDATVTEIRDSIESHIDSIPILLDEENKAAVEMLERHRQEGTDFCRDDIGYCIIDDSHYDCGRAMFHTKTGMDRSFSYDLFGEALNLMAEIGYKFIDDPSRYGNFNAHYRMAADILTKRFKILDTREGVYVLVQLICGNFANDIRSSGISNGKLQKNRSITFFMIGVMIVLESKFDDKYGPYMMEQKLRDLRYGGDWNAVDFVSRRIICNCLEVIVEKMRARWKDSTCFACKTILKLEDCKVCTGCYVNHYCSRECQRKEWPDHKDNCRRLRPYVVRFREENGIPTGNHDKFRKVWKEKTGIDI